MCDENEREKLNKNRVSTTFCNSCISSKSWENTGINFLRPVSTHVIKICKKKFTLNYRIPFHIEEW